MDCTEQTIVRRVPWLRTRCSTGAVSLSTTDKVVEYRGKAAPLLAALLPHLSGFKTVGTLAADLDVPRSVPVLVGLCQRLIDDGFATMVEDGDPGMDADRGMLYAAGRVGDPSPGLSLKTIRVVGADDEVAATSRMAPAGSTVRPTTVAELSTADADDEGIVVVWICEPNDRHVAEWNRVAYHSRRPWLPISGFDGHVAVVGPLVVPPQTPCYECYRRRRAAHSVLDEGYLDYQSVSPFRLTTTAFTHTLAAIAVTQLEVAANWRSPHVPGAVQTVSLHEGFHVDTEYVMRVPRCASCRPNSVVTRSAAWSSYYETESR